MAVTDPENAAFVDGLYARWRADPGSVSAEWRAFFRGFELGGGGAGGGDPALQARAEALFARYRDLGHLLACLDPLTACATSHPLLDPAAVGLGEADLERAVWAPGLGPAETLPLGEAVAALQEAYCRSLGVEYTHLPDPEEREWLRSRLEPVSARGTLTPGERAAVLGALVRAERLEAFLGRRYPGQTRFSLEGAETLVPQLQDLVAQAAARGVEEIVLGMAHRGRLNVHVHLLGKGLEELLCQFEATYDPASLPGGGDVKYHSGYGGAVDTPSGPVRVVLPENPSHLEAVNPVVEGVCRALQDRRGGDGAARVLPVLIHGDAAFPGQGVVAETLNLARLPGYATGGTVHVVLNNQIGYTTPPEHARSTRYATDPAKAILAPIFHVHGEDPEAVLFATRLALEYRQAFRKDVVVDLVCYRRHGHNEGDEPYFTQPELYDRIRDRPPVHELFGRALEARGEGSAEARAALVAAADHALEAAYRAARAAPCPWHPPGAPEGWEAVTAFDPAGVVATAVPAERLLGWLDALGRLPEGFRRHPKLDRILERRQADVSGDGGLDWAGAELLTFASLLAEGVGVRLSGEDSGRGTFSQRHAAWHDTATGAVHVPLARFEEGQARFQVWDSPLSEAAVLGFEYGYSRVDPQTLVLWEAQYGDFANGAQVIIDQFVASGAEKWGSPSGLVLLLPHGYEGQGPDHSTARPERFLQLAAGANLLVCQPTTPAQYFHLLRRQARAPWRVPLVVFTPKSLLRHPDARSPLAEFSAEGFAPVLADPSPPAPVARVVLCTGKVYYALAAAQRAGQGPGVALLRLEELAPFPAGALARAAKPYARVTDWVWAQDEPENMGAWPYAAPRLEAALGVRPRYVGRRAAGSPATGFSAVHRAEEERLVADALGGAKTRRPRAKKKA